MYTGYTVWLSIMYCKSAICASLHLTHSQTVIQRAHSWECFCVWWPHSLIRLVIHTQQVTLSGVTVMYTPEVMQNSAHENFGFAVSVIEMRFHQGIFSGCLGSQMTPLMSFEWSTLFNVMDGALWLQCEYPGFLRFLCATPVMHPNCFCFSCVCTVHSRYKVVK